MLVTKTVEFDMGHRLPNHNGKCRNIHGHRYKLEIGVEGEIITTNTENKGMVIDFGILKQIINDVIISTYDHSLVLYDKDKYSDKLLEMTEDEQLLIHKIGFVPTAENLAMLWFRDLYDSCIKNNIKIQYIKVWETPTSVAIYTIDDDKKYIDREQTKLFWTKKCI